jgi:hypothetical protein
MLRSLKKRFCAEYPFSPPVFDCCEELTRDVEYASRIRIIEQAYKAACRSYIGRGSSISPIDVVISILKMLKHFDEEKNEMMNPDNNVLMDMAKMSGEEKENLYRRLQDVTGEMNRNKLPVFGENEGIILKNYLFRIVEMTEDRLVLSPVGPMQKKKKFAQSSRSKNAKKRQRRKRK